MREPAEYEAFVYRWTNDTTGKVYIGYHTGNIHDGYVSSSNVFNNIYRADPGNFTRDIIYYGTTQDSYKLEQRLILEYRADYIPLYNLGHGRIAYWRRTCTWCGAVVDPQNADWLKWFERVHFENCKLNPANQVIKEPVILVANKRKPKVVKEPNPKVVKLRKPKRVRPLLFSTPHGVFDNLTKYCKYYGLTRWRIKSFLDRGQYLNYKWLPGSEYDTYTPPEDYIKL